MDLRQFAPSDEGAVMELKHPATGEVLKREGKPLWIKLAGDNSPRWRRAEQAAINRRIKAASVKQGRAVMTAAEIEQDATEKLAAVTLAWDGIELDGERLECTSENAKRFYSEVPTFFAQAQQFVFNPENFMKGGDGS